MYRLPGIKQINEIRTIIHYLEIDDLLGRLTCAYYLNSIDLTNKYH